ncbi:phosphotransferase family protein [Amycolatopsis sp. EV170708-02-1]|uniref:phosphotransferase family protein n=1 Tax=Amycolatopsis sp. EV170708-02-1 TaxID=2919322 RepID=UPI001F0C6809|nr:phosphotransferase family protein [Amycolatopsis sp. EV170708-02-1]UMP00049.1 phosphotransferase family protein [Amycolatopsis sp. EV170708-02-1]
MDELVGLPRTPVDRWLVETLGESFDVGQWHAEAISGGLSNLTYRVWLGDQSVILRRPPLGGVLPSAHDMRREWRLLTALSRTGVPVPEPLALCTDDSVIGAAFYAMSDISGAILRSPAETEALGAERRRQVSEAFVETLVRLHSLVPEQVGLQDFGRPGRFNERQVRRWRRQWDSSRRRRLADMDKLFDALEGQVPPESGVSIVHGDYRLDNVIVDLGGAPRIAAVLDWEMATLGDPLADLGLALTYWHDLGDDERALVPAAAGVTAFPGFPSAAEVADRYAELSGGGLEHLNFFLGLGSLKLAVILEGVGARFRAGHMARQDELGVDEAIRVLVARGLRHVTEQGRSL